MDIFSFDQQTHNFFSGKTVANRAESLLGDLDRLKSEYEGAKRVVQSDNDYKGLQDAMYSIETRYEKRVVPALKMILNELVAQFDTAVSKDGFTAPHNLRKILEKDEGTTKGPSAYGVLRGQDYLEEEEGISAEDKEERAARMAFFDAFKGMILDFKSILGIVQDRKGQVSRDHDSEKEWVLKKLFRLEGVAESLSALIQRIAHASPEELGTPALYKELAEMAKAIENKSSILLDAHHTGGPGGPGLSKFLRTMLTVDKHPPEAARGIHRNLFASLDNVASSLDAAGCSQLATLVDSVTNSIGVNKLP